MPPSPCMGSMTTAATSLAGSQEAKAVSICCRHWRSTTSSG